MDEYKSLFKSIDTDNDGFIDFKELKAHWRSHGINLNDDVIISMITSLDLNDDKKISLDGKKQFYKTVVFL